MQLHELAWTDQQGHPYRLTALDDGQFILQVGEQKVILKDVEALDGLHRATALVKHPKGEAHAAPIVTTPSQEETRPLDVNFPTKVRNAVLIMAALAVAILALDVFKRFS